MKDLQFLLHAYGPLLVFVNVFLEQAGLPVPAYPILVMAGALAASGDLSWFGALGAAVLACVLADTGWYMAGRRFGGGLLGTVCRLSLSVDACIRQTQSLYLKIGPRVLLAAKFLPGAGALSILMAGTQRTPLGRFWPYELGGAILWAGSALWLGFIFHDAVGTVLSSISDFGEWSLGMLAILLGLYIAYRYVRRRKALLAYQHIPRLLPAELISWRGAGRIPYLFDLRPQATVTIPHAVAVERQAPLATLGLPDDMTVDIVIFCGCPAEISAAMLAERLRRAGYVNVWALQGGFDAWHALEQANCALLAAQAGESASADAGLTPHAV